MHVHQARGIPFVMRCKVSFNKVVAAFVKSGELDATVQFKATDKAVERLWEMGIAAGPGDLLTVRLLRIDIGGAEPEVLATSLMDPAGFPHAAFKEIYSMRWGVETFFDRIKNKLLLQAFSGKCVESVKQDFHATIFLANLQSMILRAVQPQVREATSHRQHEYQVSWSKSLGLLRPVVVAVSMGADIGKALAGLFKELAKARYCEPVRKGRKAPRSKKRKRMRTKHCHWPNYKRAI
jgi:hypothetical protein